MLARRIIPCLDVRDGRVVKGVRFRSHRDVGDVVELAIRYRDEGADELVFYDITASPEARTVDTVWVSRVAAELDVPFCVAGGIRTVADAGRILEAGADKVSVNTPAVRNPSLIDALAEAFGTQCVVVGIDSRRANGAYGVHADSGDPQKMERLALDTFMWMDEVQDRGAGEIVLNCMGHDGVRAGYDIDQLTLARARAEVPLIASGGAGSSRDFVDAFRLASVDGCLAASVFHSGQLSIGQLKRELAAAGICVRETGSARSKATRQLSLRGTK